MAVMVMRVPPASGPYCGSSDMMTIESVTKEKIYVRRELIVIINNCICVFITDPYHPTNKISITVTGTRHNI